MSHARVTLAARAFAVLLGVVYAVLFWRELGSGLEFDEAYNLTVVRNLTEGLGYASNGALQGTGLLPFDPYVTTGPTVLLPAAAVWNVTGSLEATRLVPLAYFVLYLAAVWVLGRRLAGVAGGLAAVASPLLLVVGTRDLTTLSLVPGRLVGELPACALLITAVVLLPSRRTFVAALGGLCAGLAIQTKLSFLAAAGIIGLVWLVSDLRAYGRPRPGRWLAVGAAAALPTVAFEIYRWRSLGDGYRESIDALRDFLSVQSQSSGLLAARARLGALPDLLSGPGLTLLVAACLVAAIVAVLRRAGDEPADGEAGPGHSPEQRVFRALVAALVVAGVVLGALWMLRSIQPSLRQGLPTLLLCLPVVAALVAGILSRPAATATRAGVLMAAGLAAGLVAVTVFSGVRIVQGDDTDELLDQQRAAARVIEGSGTPSLPVFGWWTQPEFQVLTGLPPSSVPGAEPPKVQVFSAVRALLERGYPDARMFADSCVEQLYASWGVLVCRL